MISPVTSVQVDERGNRKGGGVMELKPCPFCGGEVNEVIKPEDRGYLTICCGLVGSMISVEEWNTRPIEDILQKRIAELETALQYERNFPSHGVERRRIV
jgi:hypothetical protein